MRRNALAALVVAWLSVAQAHAGQSLVVKWTMPSEYTNGDRLSASSIRSTALKWRKCDSSKTYASVIVAAPTTRQGVWLARGTWCLNAQATLRNGTRSKWSNTYRKLVR